MTGQSASRSDTHQLILALPVIVLFIILTTLSVSSMAATIHVPADQPTIKAGIDAAVDGDTVLVANGVYSGDGNRDLYLNKTITVKSAGGANFCIIDCEGAYATGAHNLFTFSSEKTETPVVQGFTIRNGYEYNSGGAILILKGSPRIAYNIFTGNRAGNDGGSGRGGAICCANDSSPTIVGNIITGNRAGEGGGIYCGQDSSPHIALNTISHNVSEHDIFGWGGGGIFCDSDSTPTIVENTFVGNTAETYINTEYPSHGGAICCYGASPREISKNVFRGNDADLGGGIYMASSSSTLVNNVFAQNSAESGGAIAFGWGRGHHTINSCTFYGNSAGSGGAISFSRATYSPSPGQHRLVIINSILWNDEASNEGQEVYIDPRPGTTLEISHSDVAGGTSSCFISTGSTLLWGDGMIDADPNFAAGPGGDHYLSQFAAGQTLQSPCVDTGDFSGARVRGSTRTDGLLDTGIADMGWHYFVTVREPETLITSVPDWDTDSEIFTFTFSGRNLHGSAEGLQYAWKVDTESWSPYSTDQQAEIHGLSEGAHTFSVRARDQEGRIDETPAVRTIFVEPWVADDEWINFVTGPGPGPSNPPLVRTPTGQWLAYGVPGYGVNVACGDLNGDGESEVITGPGPGVLFGPHVRCWSMSGTPLAGGSFMAYGTHRHGVKVAAGDIDGDGKDEIITGAGPGPVFGAHVRGWNHDGSGNTVPIPGVNFFAYNTPRFGVNVATGDIDGDGFDEIITGAGPGPMFGAHVRAWNHDGSGITVPIPGVNYFAYDSTRYGVEVAAGDIDGDGIDEIITAPGPGPYSASHVRGWNYDDGTLTPMAHVSFMVYGGTYGSRFGAKISAGNVDQDGKDEILTLQGPDPEASTYVYSIDVGAAWIESNYLFQVYDDWMTHGGTIAGVRAH